ncbi:MAG: peptidoglycan-binding domain-containing protein [Nocardioides sp.]
MSTTTNRRSCHQNGYSGRTLAAIVLCLSAGAGLVGTAAYATATHDAQRSATTAGHSTTAASSSSASASMRTLQEDLAQLNYYQGPIDGISNTQTTQAITYLQRDAGLPQTGQMNAATRAALNQMLANGNNEMGPG